MCHHVQRVVLMEMKASRQRANSMEGQGNSTFDSASVGLSVGVLGQEEAQDLGEEYHAASCWITCWTTLWITLDHAGSHAGPHWITLDHTASHWSMLYHTASCWITAKCNCWTSADLLVSSASSNQHISSSQHSSSNHHSTNRSNVNSQFYQR